MRRLVYFFMLWFMINIQYIYYIRYKKENLKRKHYEYNDNHYVIKLMKCDSDTNTNPMKLY